MSLQTPKPNTTPLVPGALDGRLALPDLWGIVRARKLDSPPAAVEKRLAVARRSTARAAHATIRHPCSAVPKGRCWRLEVRRAACEVCGARHDALQAVRKPWPRADLALGEQFSWLRLRTDQVSISDSASGGPGSWRPIRVLFDHTSGELLCGISNSHRFSVH